MWKAGLFCYTLLTPNSFHTAFPELQVEMLCAVCGCPPIPGAQIIYLLLCSVPAGAQNRHTELKELEDMQGQTIYNRKTPHFVHTQKTQLSQVLM